jgi:hypothetical protein
VGGEDTFRLVAVDTGGGGCGEKRGTRDISKETALEVHHGKQEETHVKGKMMTLVFDLW